MRKRFTRSIVAVAAVGLLSGLLVTPAQAASEEVCTPEVRSRTITVAGQDFQTPGRPRQCHDIPTELIPGANAYQDENGDFHVVVTNSGTVFSICMLGIDGNCIVWLDLQ